MQSDTPPKSYTTGFCCPHCGRSINRRMQLSYPASAIGQYTAVYRCGCGKHVGEPLRVGGVVREKV